MTTKEGFPGEKKDAPVGQNQNTAQIDKEFGIAYSEVERAAFDQWRATVPSSSSEGPLRITSVDEVLQLLPSAPNYTKEDIRLFFEKDGFGNAELESLMDAFCRQDPGFEIAIVRTDNRHIQVGIGDKGRHYMKNFGGGEYFAHSHPSHLYDIPNNQNLPACFVAGVMPSGGDVQGYKKSPHSIAQGTRIYSRGGHSFIKPLSSDPVGIEHYRSAYLNLFRGENALGLNSDEGVISYFREQLGLELSLAYRAHESHRADEG